MIQDNKALETWCGIKSTLMKLYLPAGNVSINPIDLQNYIVMFCPNLLVWNIIDCSDEPKITQEDEEALQHIADFETECGLLKTYSRLLYD